MTILRSPARLDDLPQPASRKTRMVSANPTQFLRPHFLHQTTTISRRTRLASTLPSSASGMDPRGKLWLITSTLNASSTKMCSRVVSISTPSPVGRVDGPTWPTVSPPKEPFKAVFSLSNPVSLSHPSSRHSMPTA